MFLAGEILNLLSILFMKQQCVITHAICQLEIPTLLDS